MLKFVNNYIEPIVLSISQTSAALNLPDGEYRLTIADSKSAATRWEIIGAIVTSGSAVLQRGLEDSSAQAWPAGSVIYNALTAGVLNQLMAALEPQSEPVPESEFLSFRRNADGSLTVSTKPSAVAGTAYDVDGVTYYVLIDDSEMSDIMHDLDSATFTGLEPIEFEAATGGTVSCLIGNLVTTHVTDMYRLFSHFTAFNAPLGFDTSSVEDMEVMFEDAISFNQPLNFDTSSVTDMYGMFMRASAFNQPLSFDTSSVDDMSRMFQGATSFNQPLDFDARLVTSMYSMFQNAVSFNQDLSGWSVPLIAGEPANFATDAASWVLPKPNFGA